MLKHISMRMTIGILGCLAAFAPHPASATPLGEAAAGMEPGEWKELATQGGPANDTLFYMNVNGDLYYGDLSATWTNYLAWNPATRELYWVGAPHLQPFGFLRYSESGNRWYNETAVPDCMRVGGYEGCFNHGYDLGTIDAAKGIFHYASGTRIFAYDIAAQRWSDWDQAEMAEARAGAMEFFPPLGKLAYLIGPTVADGGLVQLIDPVSHGLETAAHGLEMGDYDNTMEYSPRWRRLFFGGGNGSRAFYAMDSTRRAVRLADAPEAFGCSGSSLAVDPVSGEPLLLAGSNAFYAYDPAGGAWRPLAPPPARLIGGPAVAALAAAIPEHGVVFYLSPSLKKVYLYKHARGAAAIATRPVRADSEFRVLSGRKGALIIVLPDGASGTIEVLDIGGRRLASFAASSHILWSTSGRTDAGPVLIVWRAPGKPPTVLIHHSLPEN